MSESQEIVTPKRNPIDYFQEMADKMPEYVCSTNFTYEGYIERIYDIFKTAPRDLHLSVIKHYFDYNQDRAEQALETISSVDENFEYLLLDPGIALRVESFAAFAQNKKGQKPETVRREFVGSFPTVKLFRAIKLDQDKGLSENSHLAPAIRGLAKDSPEDFRQALKKDIQWVVENYAANKDDHFEIPLLAGFSENAVRHVGNRSTDSIFISASGFEEVAWYAAANTEDTQSSSWPDGTSVAIYAFDINSFYALSRELFFEKPLESRRKKIEVGNFSVDYRDPNVELLIPFSLPQGFYKNSITLTKKGGVLPNPNQF